MTNSSIFQNYYFLILNISFLPFRQYELHFTYTFTSILSHPEITNTLLATASRRNLTVTEHRYFDYTSVTESNLNIYNTWCTIYECSSILVLQPNTLQWHYIYIYIYIYVSNSFRNIKLNNNQNINLCIKNSHSDVWNIIWLAHTMVYLTKIYIQKCFFGTIST